MRHGQVYHIDTHGELDVYLRWCPTHGHVVTVDTSLYLGQHEFRCPACDRAFFHRQTREAAAARS